MATLPASDFAAPLVSLEEYLHTSYHPDCDYVDGRIEERNLGEKEHSILQRYLTFLFMLKRAEWGVEVFPELRTQTHPETFRVPDVLVVRAGQSIDRYLTEPPLIAIEILSPEDRLSRFQERIDDYLDFGVEHIWILDPASRRAWTADRTGLHLTQTGELTVSETPIRLVLGELFAELDR